MYRDRLETYKSMGVNLIRVWGGCSRERDQFYDLCDELGMLVWQELPLSSSGLDNRPPDDPQFCEQFAQIASYYAKTLHWHPSLLVWSGRNELAQPEPGVPGSGLPCTFDHPALGAARSAIREYESERKIVPASPSGARYSADAESEEFGTGVHHDVHDPWGPADKINTAEWKEYWADDDAMLRSEVGIAGSSDLELLERYSLVGQNLADRFDIWRHTSNWWIEKGDIPEGPLAEWVKNSQDAQAEALCVAVQATMDRFSACGGFFVWMGHDSFPCAVSLSPLDYDGRMKPAAVALGKTFRRTLPGE